MELTCDVCGKGFTSTRADARYCSGRCRTLAYRVRRDGEQPKRPRSPLPNALKDRAYDLGKALDALDRLTTDDRFPRYRRTDDASYLAGRLDAAARTLDEIRTRLPSVTRD